MELLPGPSFDGARKIVSFVIVALYRPPSRLSSLLIRLHPPFLVRGPSYVAHSPPFVIFRPLHRGYKQAITRIRIYLLRLLCLSGGMRLLLGSEAFSWLQTVPRAEKLGGRYHASLLVPERGQLPEQPEWAIPLTVVSCWQSSSVCSTASKEEAIKEPGGLQIESSEVFALLDNDRYPSVS